MVMFCPNCQRYLRNKPGIHSEQVYIQLSYQEVSEKGRMSWKYRCPSCKCEFVVIEQGEREKNALIKNLEREGER
ncbi:MAG: hypothetical protein GF308_08155 [Candidatus Heimdallarchaeota archaeon]|nr:hypothetical protein [Candidatus Heimdallarchaeota archaeon]